jgi:hypothetical protein
MIDKPVLVVHISFFRLDNHQNNSTDDQEKEKMLIDACIF